MDKREVIPELITKQGLLPLYFHSEGDVSINVLRALYAAGVRVVEYTNRGEAALRNFQMLRSFCDSSCNGLMLGAGTIKDAAQATRFIDAGADFLVSPGLAEDVFDVAYSNKIFWIPGCMTPTEIIRAEQFGISMIKLFPGSVLGPAFVHAVREVFPALQFMPTGGVELSRENLAAWFAAGVCAVGMGSKLIAGSMMEKADYSGITSQAEKALQLIREIRER